MHAHTHMCTPGRQGASRLAGGGGAAGGSVGSSSIGTPGRDFVPEHASCGGCAVYDPSEFMDPPAAGAAAAAAAGGGAAGRRALPSSGLGLGLGSKGCAEPAADACRHGVTAGGGSSLTLAASPHHTHHTQRAPPQPSPPHSPEMPSPVARAGAPGGGAQLLVLGGALTASPLPDTEVDPHRASSLRPPLWLTD